MPAELTARWIARKTDLRGDRACPGIALALFEHPRQGLALEARVVVHERDPASAGPRDAQVHRPGEAEVAARREHLRDGPASDHEVRQVAVVDDDQLGVAGCRGRCRHARIEAFDQGLLLAEGDHDDR